ncbi:hypothetical protein EOM09_05210 [bacterium]|nr:hypothetical protein [bacterium]
MKKHLTIAGIGIVVLVLAFFTWQFSNQGENIPNQPSENQYVSGSNLNSSESKEFLFDIDAYQRICDGFSIKYSIYKNSEWNPVISNLPQKGLYYIGDKWTDYGGCAYSDECFKVDSPIKVTPFQYVEIAKKRRPTNTGIDGIWPTAPVFKKEYLKGKIKIDIQYYSDDKCNVKDSISKIVEIQ